MSYPSEFKFLPNYSPNITRQWEYSDASGLWHGINNCVGHALACLISYLHKANTGASIDFSYQWVYGNRASSDYQLEGMWIYEALPHLQAQGAPPYDIMPRQNTYDLVTTDTYPHPDDTSVSLPDVPLAKNDVTYNYSSVIGTAIQYKISGWGEVSYGSISTIKSRVMKAPVILDIDICDLDTSGMYYHSSLESAIIQNRPDSQTPGYGYHALLIIGWKVVNGIPYWIVRNNWGWWWGYDGEALLPMSYGLVRQAFYVTYAYNSIGTFAWDFVRTPGMSYANNKIKATEWNRLVSKVKELYARFNGSNLYLSNVSAGATFTASAFNNVRNYINSLASKNGVATLTIPTVSTGSTIYADYFNQIQSKVNELVAFANS